MKKSFLAAFALAFALIALPGQASAAITSDLSLGSRGADVTELQTYLASDASLYPEGLITGYYGSLTEAAVKRFQARYGIAQVGRVGPITRAQLNALLGGAPSGADTSAPVMTPSSVSIASNSATIAWTTSESARHRVMYGSTWPFLYATAPSVLDASVDGTAAVTIAGLSPNTLYHFVRESIDAAGNIMWTVGETFRTNP